MHLSKPVEPKQLVATIAYLTHVPEHRATSHNPARGWQRPSDHF